METERVDKRPMSARDIKIHRRTSHVTLGSKYEFHFEPENRLI